tara:strand:+ start:244 stop:666 length:423 start_codon:yes stop_codon:yes gene_type:complete
MSMTMAQFIQAAKEWPEITWDTQSTVAGCTVRRHFADVERYVVDFASDFRDEGWIQFDTDQDFAHFGVWVNPRLRLILTCCEGDWDIEECPTAEHYNDSIERISEHYGSAPAFTAIDTDSGSVTQVFQDRAECFTTGGAV